MCLIFYAWLHMGKSHLSHYLIEVMVYVEKIQRVLLAEAQ